MIAMSPSIQLKGSYKFSMKKLVAGGEMAQSIFTGPGELLLAPPMLGDITTLRVAGGETWSVSHDGYLGSTQNVTKDYKRQGIGKAMFSGEGLWVYKISGTGLLWLTSFGAIIRKDVSLCPFVVCLGGCGVEGANAGDSWRKGKSISLITGISWRGTRNTCSSEWRRAGSCPGSRRPRGWCASLRGRGRCLSRRGTRYVVPLSCFGWYDG
jgi:hypothetical protein